MSPLSLAKVFLDPCSCPVIEGRYEYEARISCQFHGKAARPEVCMGYHSTQFH